MPGEKPLLKYPASTPIWPLPALLVFGTKDAPAAPLPDKLLACVTYLTPNETETELLTGVAVRDEDSAREAAERLLAAGKPRKVIRIALAHKLLVRLNAKAREVRQRLQLSSPIPSAVPAGSL